MAKILYTMWALFLSTLGLPIFRSCFANAMEDEDCESLLSGPPLSSFFFNLGVYIIIVNSTLFPRTFREPKKVFLVMYEFLATAFLLEFALACVWTPIDILLINTLPSTIHQMLREFGFKNAAAAFMTNKSSVIVITYTVALAFFLVSLHVTDAVDYTIIRNDGVMPFAMDAKEKLWERLQQEFPLLEENTKICRCKVRKRRRSKNNANNSR